MVLLSEWTHYFIAAPVLASEVLYKPNPSLHYLTSLYMVSVCLSTTSNVVFSPHLLIFSTTVSWSSASTDSPFTATRISLSFSPALAAGLPESMSLIKWPDLQKNKKKNTGLVQTEKSSCSWDVFGLDDKRYLRW